MITNIDPPSSASIKSDIRLDARDRRVRLGLTQRELAHRAGVPLSTLRRFEQTGEVSLNSLIEIAVALGATRGFSGLFPEPAPRTLDEFEARTERRGRSSTYARAGAR